MKFRWSKTWNNIAGQQLGDLHVLCRSTLTKYSWALDAMFRMFFPTGQISLSFFPSPPILLIAFGVWYKV